MGKMKVHELAKELNMPSKELVDKLIELKYDIKSHLSILEDSEVEKIRKQLKGKSADVAPKADKAAKKDKKPIAPVIIRREVTRIETVPEVKKVEKKETRNDLGVVQRRTDTSMNIKYRTPPRKIGTITPQAEAQKEEPKKEEVKKEEVKNVQKIEKVEDVKKVEQEVSMKEVKSEIKEEAKPVVEVKEEKVSTVKVQTVETEKKVNKEVKENVVSSQTSTSNANNNQRYNNNRFNDGQKPRFDNRNQNGDNRFQNRDGNRDNRFQNRDGNRDNRFQNRDGNRDNRFQNRDGNRDNKFQNKDGNRDNKFNNRQPQTRESKVEKDIKGILANTEVAQKEPARENVRTGYKDKEKDNRKFEESTKKNKGKGRNENRGDDINIGKLKDIQSESNFSNMFNDTESKMFDYYDLSRRKGNRKNKKKPTESKEHIDQKIFELTDIDIPETITVKDLAEKLKKQASEVIKKLLGYGILATLNNELDFDTAFLVATEFGVTAHKKEVVSDEDILFDDTDDAEEDLMPRPPIVVVMGHVDHGKTSLLDAIRATNVTEREAGGITQHIGAYKVEINGREITFIDTPGHEAFTAMRARGAQVTDVAIIVVAADDGIMPQTVEAINHAKAAGVSIIVAINKIDREGANIDRVKQEIMEYGLVPEEWGGDVICVPISAKFNKNIDSLLEMVLLVADMKELKSNPNKQAKGTIIEARLDKNTGITASLLVQRGTLNIGDTIVVGSVIGKIRGMTDDKGQKVKAAGPSTPVEIIGLPEVPEAGETFYEVENEKVAKHLIEKRKRKQREEMIKKSSPVTLDNLFNQIEEGKLKDLNIIVKADLQGSVQALKASLEKIKNEEARVRIIHSNVGGITESDVTLAKVTNSIIIGFNVRAEANAKTMAEKEGVEVKLYSVIYTAIDDVEAALKGMLQPKYKEVIQGTAEIRQTFKITGAGMIAGCYVLDGKIVRNSGLRVIRDNVVIHTGKLASLKRMKDDAKEVAEGYECGVQVENYEDIKVGDKLESFIMEEIKQ
ncbi:MAG: translation initiation factor IF-2 [Clostridia bacterium]|nr:translation initiation factor IF-2 [Clostridia bacterium]